MLPKSHTPLPRAAAQLLNCHCYVKYLKSSFPQPRFVGVFFLFSETLALHPITGLVCGPFLYTKLLKFYVKWKEALRKDYIWYNSIYMFLGLFIHCLCRHCSRQIHRRESGLGPGLDRTPSDNNHHYWMLKGLALPWNLSIIPILWMRKLGHRQSYIENKLPKLGLFLSHDSSFQSST